MTKTPGTAAPKRPASLAGKCLAAAFAAALVCGLVAFWAVPLFHMGDDLLLHFTGTPARASDCVVETSGVGKYRDHDLDVRYTTTDGQALSFVEEINFNNWARNPDESTPCEVRYAPSSPWRYSTNWGFERLLSRFVVFLVFKAWALVVTVIVLGVLFEGLRGRWRRWRVERAG